MGLKDNTGVINRDMAYKITDTAIIIESDGETILIADQLQYEESITFLRDSDFSLPNGYVDN